LTGSTSRPESATGSLKHYGTLAYGAIGTMLDAGLVVVGTLFVSLGVATLVGGFGLVGQIEMSTGAFLASALIVGIVGLFALGVAAEGPLGRGRRLVGYNIWEVGIARAIASFLVGFGFLVLQGFLVGFLDDLPAVVQRGAEGLHAAAVAGMIAVPLIGVPLSILLRSMSDGDSWAQRLEYPSIFIVWVVATMVSL
jgi:hypothetical protein